MKPDREEEVADRPEATRANPAWKIALVAVPVFLALSSALAMWMWWKRSQEEDLDPRLALAASSVATGELDDHLRKLSVLLGRRDWDSAGGRKNMRRAIAFIEGTLSPLNYGFVIVKGEHLSHDDELWPTVWVDLKGQEEPENVVLVTADYDVSDAAVAVVLAAANDLRDEEMSKTVRFVFFPALLYLLDEGKDLIHVLEEDESHVVTLEPDLPAVSGESLQPDTWNGAQLKPVADDLVQKVRKLAQ